MNKIEFGNNIDTMKRWASEGVRVQTCVTSPPYYGLRSYLPDDHPDKPNEIGIEETPAEYIAKMVEVFRGVRDILADDGTLWLNIGDSYYNYRPGKGQSMIKQTVSNTNQDLPTTCARRGNKLEGLKEKDLIGIPWMLAFALRDDGWYLRQEIIWSKLTPMPESVIDRCTKSHEQIFLLTKNPHYYFDVESIMEPALTTTNKPQKIGGNKYHGEESGEHFRHSGTWEGGDKRRKRSVWTVGPSPYKGSHFAAFPPKLIEPCILAGSKIGDIVFDPFMGSGTTAATAIQLNRKYLGCELNTEYQILQQERIDEANNKNPHVIESDGTFGNGLFNLN